MAYQWSPSKGSLHTAGCPRATFGLQHTLLETQVIVSPGTNGGSLSLVLSATFCLGAPTPSPPPDWLTVPRKLFSSEEDELKQEPSQTLSSTSSRLSPLLRTPGWRAGQGQGPSRWADGGPPGPWVGRRHTGGLPVHMLPYGDRAGGLQSTSAQPWRSWCSISSRQAWHSLSSPSQGEALTCNQFSCHWPPPRQKNGGPHLHRRTSCAPPSHPLTPPPAAPAPCILLPHPPPSRSLEQTLPSCAAHPPPAPGRAPPGGWAGRGFGRQSPWGFLAHQV